MKIDSWRERNRTYIVWPVEAGPWGWMGHCLTNFTCPQPSPVCLLVYNQSQRWHCLQLPPPWSRCCPCWNHQGRGFQWASAIWSRLQQKDKMRKPGVAIYCFYIQLSGLEATLVLLQETYIRGEKPQASRPFCLILRTLSPPGHDHQQPPSVFSSRALAQLECALELSSCFLLTRKENAEMCVDAVPDLCLS